MDLDDMLIEEVRNRPFLYDLAQKDYKNLKKKDYAWKEIAARTKLGGKVNYRLTKSNSDIQFINRIEMQKKMEEPP